MNYRTLILIAAVTGCSLVGCAADQHQTQKAAATAQWNAARANVLGSLAKDQYGAGNLDKSRETTEQALQLDPKNVALYLLMARVEIEQSNLESAQRCLVSAAQLAPKNAEVDYLMGVVHQRWQRPEQALASYQSAVTKSPDDIAYVLAQAEMLVALDRRPEALASLKSRVVYFEHSAAIRDAIGQLLDQSGDTVAAIDYYRQASVLDGEDVNIRERLGSLLYRTGDYRSALSQLQRVIKAPENAARPELLLMAAECELQVGSPLEARRKYDDVVNVDETNADGWLGIAKSSLRIGDLRRAESGAVKAAAILPKSAEAQMVLGYVRMKQTRYDDAVLCFRRASAADRTDAVSLSMAGVALQQQGRLTDAVNMFHKALAIDPKDELATRSLAAAQ